MFLEYLKTNIQSNELEKLYFSSNIKDTYHININSNLQKFEYANNQQISSANILAPCNTIPVDCFGNCNSLKYVNLNNSISVLEHEAFEYCTNLEKISLPENVLSIGYDCFYNCKNLNSIIFNDKLKIIDSGAFDCCQQLTHLSISNNILSIN